ncbi:Uncharacterized protein Fot_47017 [Forsythia ovata]|uniref:Uncharacterized protein n=1 Tax=Forsythia ovata TaxID=205694 RepID=A0ABD1QPB9_9LAMI
MKSHKRVHLRKSSKSQGRTRIIDDNDEVQEEGPSYWVIQKLLKYSARRNCGISIAAALRQSQPRSSSLWSSSPIFHSFSIQKLRLSIFRLFLGKWRDLGSVTAQLCLAADEKKQRQPFQPPQPLCEVSEKFPSILWISESQ